jgi:hypothetical protein
VTGITLLIAGPSRETTFWLLTGGASLAFALGILAEPLSILANVLGVPYLPLYDTDAFFAPALFSLLTFACLSGRDTWRKVIDAGKARGAALVAATFLLLLGGNPAVLREFDFHAVPTYAFYETISSEREDFIVLTYPFGLANSQDKQRLGEGAFLSEYALWHHKRTVSGVAPHYEPATHEALRDTGFLFPDSLSANALDAAAENMAAAVQEWRIGYIVAHEELLAPQTLHTIDVLSEESGVLCPPVERDGLVIFRARWHPAGCESE